MIDVLLCGDTKQNLKNTIYPRSKAVTFVFPVQVYSVVVCNMNEDSDPIRAAIKRLLAYYQAHPLARKKDKNNNELSNVAMVANALGLKEKLVEYIIQDEKNKQPHLSSEAGDDTVVRSVKPIRFYVVVDGISKKLLDYIIDEGTFNSLKVEQSDIEPNGNNAYLYRSTIGSSERDQLIRLKSDTQSSISAPDKDDILSLLKLKTKRKQFKKLILDPKIVLDGDYELAVTCYYARTDANNFFAANPFNKGGSQMMTSVICGWISSGTSAGKTVLEHMNKSRPAVVESDSGKYVEINKEIKIRLREAYPILAKDSELLNRYANMFLSYVRVVQLKAQKQSQNNDGNEYKRHAAEVFALMDYRVAAYTFLEFLLLRSFVNNYDDKNEFEYYNILDNYRDKDKVELKDWVEQIGFSVGGLNNSSYAYAGDIKKLFDNAHSDIITKSTTRLYILLLGNLIEASCDEDHPLNVIQNSCPQFISMIIAARDARNSSKHGNVFYKMFEYGDLYFYIQDAFNAIIGAANDNKKLPQPKDFIQSQELGEAFDAAYDTAVQTLATKELPQNRDAYEQLLCETISYLLNDNEYASKLSNLYDELLYQLIRDMCQSDIIEDKTYGDVLICDGMSIRGAVQRANDILKSRGILEDVDAFEVESVGNLIKHLEKKRINMLSTREKLLYYILCLHHYKRGDWGSTFSQSLGDLITNTLSSLRLRGHNEEANFKEHSDEYKKLHDDTLELYKYFATILK